jgi:hypothetical protein
MEDFITQEEFIYTNGMDSIQIEDIMSAATSAGLMVEVLVAAFNHKGQFPESTTLECLQVGAEDWDVFG